ncbi:MAG: hypothetical protein AB7I30_18345, partial [Isosphaeraceae bacterium]
MRPSHHETRPAAAKPPRQQPAVPDPSLRPVVERPDPHPEVIVYSHSPLFFWWPVWVVGFIMAGITYWVGQSHQVGNDRVWFYPSSNLGVIFFLTLFLVILISNVTVRGLASAVVVLSAVLVTVL